MKFEIKFSEFHTNSQTFTEAVAPMCIFNFKMLSYKLLFLITHYDLTSKKKTSKVRK